MLAKHWNQNLICAVDCETTGLDCRKHEIIQLAIIPLTINYEYNKDFDFFDIKVRPENIRDIDKDAEKITRGLIVDSINNGMERWTSVERFEEWFAKLRLPPKKGIIPLGMNWCFDRDFIREWIGGGLNYSAFFRDDYRDVQKLALALNDFAHHRSEPIPFPKTNLTYLATTLGVQHRVRHNALEDALCTADVYRALVSTMNYSIQTSPVPDGQS